MSWITAPWPWYVTGPLIAIVMALMIVFGKRFGVSSTLQTICSIGGARRLSDYFDIDWKASSWNLFFVLGAIIGGFIATRFMSSGQPMELSDETMVSLQSFGIENPGQQFLPQGLFAWASLASFRGLIFMVLGGFLVGFGTRYAGGCTSGHAISGLSNLQWPSLIAVVGFFVGGLIVTHLVLPVLL